MQNYKVLVAISFLSLVFSLSAIILVFKPVQQEKPSVSVSDNSCSAEDLLEIKMKIIARHTFNQGLGFSEGIYSLTEEELNHKCVSENLKREYKIAKECYLSNKGCGVYPIY